MKMKRHRSSQPTDITIMRPTITTICSSIMEPGRLPLPFVRFPPGVASSSTDAASGRGGSRWSLVEERRIMYRSRSLTACASRSRRWIGVGVALLSAALVSGACTSSSDAATVLQVDRIQLLNSAEFAEFLDDYPDADLLNVHVPYQGHIEGTDAFVDFEQILRFDGLPRNLDDPVLLYCRSGNMSGQAAAALEDAGYTNIVDLEGGMNAWRDSGRELLIEEPAQG